MAKTKTKTKSHKHTCAECWSDQSLGSGHRHRLNHTSGVISWRITTTMAIDVAMIMTLFLAVRHDGVQVVQTTASVRWSVKAVSSCSKISESNSKSKGKVKFNVKFTYFTYFYIYLPLLLMRRRQEISLSFSCKASMMVILCILRVRSLQRLFGFPLTL